jgi:histidinol-phosphate aminotransferase
VAGALAGLYIRVDEISHSNPGQALMAVSRRTFVATIGATGAGMLTKPLISWRGHEALMAQAQQPAQTGVSDRKADRMFGEMPGMIRIDSNENPNGPGERALEVMRQSFGKANRYPVKGEDDLIAAIAKTHGITPDKVILGCGSGELLRAAVNGYASRERALVMPDPTFEAPGTWAKFRGIPIVSPKVDSELKIDLNATADASKGAGLVYFCNPNNPTATVHKASDVNAFVEQLLRASPDTTILIDEAYHEYVDDPGYATAIPLALANPRVFVTRTFSKVFGMAGMRVGYAVGQPATIAKVQQWCLGSNVNQLALSAATSSVADKAHIASEQHKNRAARAYTVKFFESAGYKPAKSDANFIMVDLHRDSKAFKLECVKHKVAIGRQFPALPTYARVGIGTMPEMKKATEVFKAVLGASAAAQSSSR